MWSFSESLVFTMVTAIPGILFDGFMVKVTLDEAIVYRFPDSRIAAANSIADNSFPSDFLFGVGTSSYQIEGAWNKSDKSPSIWDEFTHIHPELIQDHSNGDVAADSYHNYKDDIDLVEKLGAKSYRISLSWPRILPEGLDNRISESGVEYYNNVINEMLRRGITPVLTLYHWDLPQRLQDLGGWANPFIVDWFVDYARVAFTLFGDRVKIWSTLNEPVIFCLRGYGQTNAPYVRQPGVADYLCGHHALLAHAKVYRLYEREFRWRQRGKVGIVMSTAWPMPENEGVKAYDDAAERYFQFWNGWFMHPIFHTDGDYPPIMRNRVDHNSEAQGFKKSRLPVFTPDEIEMIKGSSDYLGINFYSASKVRPLAHNSMSNYYDDDIGTEYVPDYKNSFEEQSTPEALGRLIHEFNAQYKIPMIYITENGYGDQGQLIDIGRAKYHHEHLSYLLRTMRYGVDVRGYFAWSLLDNFEWMKGYSRHYGLYKVDFDDPDRKRAAKLSTEVLGDIYRTKRIPELKFSLEEVTLNVT